MRSLLAATLLAAVFSLPACTADRASEEGSSTNAVASADAVKVLATGRTNPGDLLFAGGKIYWSETATASGVPAPGQEGIGSYWSFNVTRSRSPKRLSTLYGTIQQIFSNGSSVYTTDANGVYGATFADLDAGAPFGWLYDDRVRADHDGGAVSSAAVYGGRLYVLRTTGELVVVQLAGVGEQEPLESGGDATALSIDAEGAFWLGNSEDGTERAVWHAKLGETSATEIAHVPSNVTSLVVDADQGYFVLPAKPDEPGSGAIMRLSLTEGGTPARLVAGLDSVRTLVVDGDQLLFTGRAGGESALFRVAKTGEDARAEILYRLDEAAGILPTADAIFVTSTARDGDSGAGSVVRIARSGI